MAKKPIRVLQVFARMDRGGSETMIMNYYRNIDKEKVQFDFVVHTDDVCAFDKEIENLGGRIFHLPRYTLKNHFQYIKLWKDLLKSHPEYKIIHGHYFSISAIYFFIAKKFDTIKIAHSHIAIRKKDIKSLLLKLFTLPVRYLTDYYFACSIIAGEWLYGKNKKIKKDLIIHKNSINTELFKYNESYRREIRAELNIDHKFVLGHVGRFNSQKNHNFLIDIFKAILEKEKNSILLLVGEGELRASIEKKVSMLGIEANVLFLGSRSDVHKIIQAIDVFIFPSFYEGLPVTVIEAQTSGLKCFISNTISNEVKITDVVDFLSINKSADYWADRILEYANGYQRTDKLIEVKNAGYDIFESAKWLQDFYLKALKLYTKI